MNKRVLFLLVAVLTTASYTQAQVKIGLRAGGGITNLLSINEEKNLASVTTAIPGFKAGVVVEYMLGPATSKSDIGIQTGLSFVTLGGKTALIIGSDRTTNLNYVQLPINIEYKHNFSRNSLLIYAGPYFGYAISGKNKAKILGEDVEAKITFGTGSDAFMKGFDAGVGAGVGFQFGNFQIAPEVKMSMMNLSVDKGIKMTNIGLLLNATYLFGK